MPQPVEASARKLYLASALMLFLELTLIRWLGESILYLAFFTNFVLLASFLGIGLGFLSKQRSDWFRHLPLALALLLSIVLIFPIRVDRSAPDVIFIGTGRPAGLPIWAMLPLVFTATALIMAMVGQRVARYFKVLEPLRAYRLDILGSVSGIGAFAGLAALRARPVVWAIVIVGLVVAVEREVLQRSARVALLGIVALLGVQSVQPGWSWSPYYRVEVLSDSTFTYISVNGIPHQATGTIHDLREIDWIADWPYRVRASPEAPGDVLIVGAGNGNDVAYALDYDAEHVDAVEIDPRIYELGRSLNPQRPYQDPRVSIHIDDGRAFMQRTDAEYDLVLFALPDSLTSVAGQSNLRLESYLFTVEAFEQARRLLTAHGIFALYNLHTDEWVVDRMAVTMAEVFGEAPCQLGDAATRARVMLAVGPGVDPQCPGGVVHDAIGPDPVTDDRPYLYIREREIPAFYLVALALILLVSALSVRAQGGTLAAIMRNLDLFLMGMAFLLLETKSISQFALWFGTTWNVNTLVFVGVLGSVLAAIEVSRRMTRPAIGPLYALLLGSVAASWAIPASFLLTLPFAVRWIVASAITFTPIFVANLVFAQRFKVVNNPAAAFGVNLLGAMLGGVMEYLALVTGYRALAIIVAGLYCAALVVWRTQSSAAEMATAYIAT
jgi:hypothetical protein